MPEIKQKYRLGEVVHLVGKGARQRGRVVSAQLTFSDTVTYDVLVRGKVWGEVRDEQIEPYAVLKDLTPEVTQ